MDFNKLIKDNVISIILFVALLNYGFIHFCVIPGQTAAAALQDYGFISVLTALFIVACQLMVIWNFIQSNNRTEKIGAFALAYVLQIYFMRESDLHHFFTERSVAGIRYFKNMDYPLLPKLIAGPILVLFIACFAYILIRYSLFTLKAFFRGEPWAVAVGFWGTLLVGAQIWDRCPLHKEETYGWRVALIEEYMEFMASVYLPTAMILYLRMRKKLET